MKYKDEFKASHGLDMVSAWLVVTIFLTAFFVTGVVTPMSPFDQSGVPLFASSIDQQG